MFGRGRWRLECKRAELIHCWELTPEEKARAEKPLACLSSSEVLDEWSRSCGHDAASIQLLEIAKALGAPDWSTVSLARETIERAVRSGTVIALRDPWPEPGWSPTRRNKNEESDTRPAKTTWFSVCIVDELGDAVDGVELAFVLEDGEHRVTTDGRGKARLQDAKQSTASLRIANAAKLREKMDERWSEESERDWCEPQGSAIVLEMCHGGPIPAVSLSAEVERRVVLVPPYRIRLHDSNQQAMPRVQCTVITSGGRQELMSDGAGWIEVALGQSCPKTVKVAWGDSPRYEQELVVECCDGEREAVALARLNNLGYREHMVAAFDADRGMSAEPTTKESGGLPERTRDELARIWQEQELGARTA